MKIHDEVNFPASPGEVAAMLADPSFSEQVSAHMGATSATVDVAGAPEGAFTVTTVRTLPTDSFPDFARKLVGNDVEVRQVDVWQAPDAEGARAGTLTVEVVGAPLRLNGTMRLTPAGNGTIETIDGDLKAGVPLIGGKLEKASEPAIGAAIRQQIKVGTAWFS